MRVSMDPEQATQVIPDILNSNLTWFPLSNSYSDSVDSLYLESNSSPVLSLIGEAWIISLCVSKLSSSSSKSSGAI